MTFCMGLPMYETPTQGNKRVQEEACKEQTDGNKFASFFCVLVNIPLGFIIAGNQWKSAVFCIILWNIYRK